MYCVGSDPGSPGSNAVTWLQVVAINVTVNALLVVLLSYMTITTVKILTTVQFQVCISSCSLSLSHTHTRSHTLSLSLAQVVSCRLVLALPKVTAKKLYKSESRTLNPQTYNLKPWNPQLLT